MRGRRGKLWGHTSMMLCKTTKDSAISQKKLNGINTNVTYFVNSC